MNETIKGIVFVILALVITVMYFIKLEELRTELKQKQKVYAVPLFTIGADTVRCIPKNTDTLILVGHHFTIKEISNLNIRRK